MPRLKQRHTYSGNLGYIVCAERRKIDLALLIWLGIAGRNGPRDGLRMTAAFSWLQSRGISVPLLTALVCRYVG